MKIQRIYLFIPFLISVSNTTDVERVDNLTTTLLKDYNKKTRPVNDNKQKLNVSFSFHIRTINYYDEVAGVLSILCGIQLWWLDYRLAWNPLEYDNITVLNLLRSDIWYPEVFATNVADNLSPVAIGVPIPSVVVANGMVWMLLSDQIKYLCKSDMSYFPFDRQECKLVLGSWNYYTHDIYLVRNSTMADLRYYFTNNIWTLETTSIDQYKEGDYEGFLQITLHLRRKPLYFCINMLAPMMALALLNTMAFLIPAHCGERISYSVTIFLSFVVFMTLMSDYLPKSSTNLSYFSYFSLILIFYSAIITIESTLIMRLHYRNQDEPVSSTVKCLYNVLSLKVWKVCLGRGKTKVCAEKCHENDIPCKGTEFPKKTLTYGEIALKFDTVAFTYSVLFVISISLAYLFLVFAS